jgi:hypothetical protein
MKLTDEEIDAISDEYSGDKNDLRYFARAIEAAVNAKWEALQWQPIETAPMDGAAIILCRDDRVTCGHWESERLLTDAEYHSSTGEYLGQFETGEVVEAWWYSEDGGFSTEAPPTHWMPLPQSPKESA